MLQFTPIRGKLFQPTGYIATYLFSIAANCNNGENYTIVTIVVFIYNYGYTSSLLSKCMQVLCYNLPVLQKI